MSEVEANLLALIENTRGVIWSIDRQYCLIIANSQYISNLKTYFGYDIKKGDCVLLPQFPSPIRDEWKGYYDRAMKGETFVIQKTPFCINHILHLQYHFAPIFLDDGQISGVTVLGIDITEQKLAEQQLFESRALLQGVLNHAPVFIFAKDLQGRITLANPKLETFFQVGKGEMIGKTDYDFHSPEIADHNWNVDQDVQQSLRTIEREELGVDEEGITHTYLSIKFPLFDELGELIGTCGISTDITERKRTEEVLRESESRYRTLVNNFPDGVVLLFDRDMRFQVAGGNRLGVLGMSPEMLEGKTIWECLPPEVTAIGASLYQSVLDGTAPAEIEQHYGDHVYRTQPVSLRNEQGEIIAGMIISQEITEQKRAKEQLQYANEQLLLGNQRLQQHNQDMMLLNQMGDMLQSCQQREEAYHVIATNVKNIFDEQPGGLYVRRSQFDFFDRVAQWGDSPHASPTIAEHCCQCVNRHQVVMFSHGEKERCCCYVQHMRNDVRVLCVPLTVQDETLGVLHLYSSNMIIEGETRERWIQLAEAVARQISLALNNLMLRERLQQQAIQDGLTGLYNRRYLDETLPRELHRAIRQQQPLGVIMLDIDHFKKINDAYGHDAGDAVLRALGSTLQQSVRDGDMVCRYGGEEFTLVLPGASREHTRRRAEDIRKTVQMMSVRHNSLVLDMITVSLGVAIFPEHSNTAEGVIKAADQALYRAKHGGRNQVVISRKKPAKKEV